MKAKVRNWFCEFRWRLSEWKQYNVRFSSRAAFISSLLTCYHLVNLVVVGVLTTYISDSLDSLYEDERPQKLFIAATFDKVHGGLTTIFEVILIFISYSHFGSFKTVLLSAASCIAGLVILLFWEAILMFWEGRTLSGLLVLNTMAIFCLALGCGGEEILTKFQSEQLRAKEPTGQPIEENRVMARNTLWDRATWFIAAVVSVFLFGNFDWGDTFGYSAYAMLFSYLVFFCGIRFYHRKEVTSRTRNLETSTGTAERTSCFSQAMQECKSESVTMFLLPTWGFSIMLGIGISTADTFFQEQADDLKFPFDITALLLLQAISGRAFSFLYDFIESKCQPADCEITESRKTMRSWIKIWIGMLLMVACLLVGWRVEAYRHTSKFKGEIPHLSLWLSLQFLLLGPGKTFAEDGLNNLLEEHLGDPLKKYGPSLIRFATKGLGNFSSIILLQVLKDWFPYDLDSSRLDKYYLVVAILNFLNLSCSILWKFNRVMVGSAAVQALPYPPTNEEQPTAEEEATQSGNGRVSALEAVPYPNPPTYEEQPTAEEEATQFVNGRVSAVEAVPYPNPPTYEEQPAAEEATQSGNDRVSAVETVPYPNPPTYEEQPAAEEEATQSGNGRVSALEAVPYPNPPTNEEQPTAEAQSVNGRVSAVEAVPYPNPPTYEEQPAAEVEATQSGNGRVSAVEAVPYPNPPTYEEQPTAEEEATQSGNGRVSAVD